MASVQLVLFVMSMKAIVVPIVFHVGDVVDELSLAAPPPVVTPIPDKQHG